MTAAVKTVDNANDSVLRALKSDNENLHAKPFQCVATDKVKTAYIRVWKRLLTIVLRISRFPFEVQRQLWGLTLDSSIQTCADVLTTFAIRNSGYIRERKESQVQDPTTTSVIKHLDKRIRIKLRQLCKFLIMPIAS